MTNDGDITRTDGGPTLDAGLSARLGSVAVRLRWFVFLEGLAWVVGFLLAALLVQFALDFGLRGLRWSMRAASLVAILGGTGYLTWVRVVRPLKARVGHAEIANLLERRYPQLSSLLISAVRFASGHVGASASNSPALIASVVKRAERAATGLDFAGVLEPRPMRRSLAGLAGAGVVVAALVLSAPETSALWFSRNVLLRDVPWPQQTRLIVDIEGRELLAARGDDVVIEAHADGVQPRVVEIHFETDSGQRGRETMVTVGSSGSLRYRYTFKGAQEDAVFTLEGGDDVTDDYAIRLLDRPRVTSGELHVTPPAYTGLEPIALADGQRSVQVLPGSGIGISVRTSKPVVEAKLMADADEIAEAAGQRDRFEVQFDAFESHTYHFALTDEAGLTNKRPARFAVRVIKDEPPRVRMKLEGVEDMITPEAVLPVELDCGDKYGLADVELVYDVLREGSRSQRIDLPTFKPGTTRFMTTLHWPAAAAGVVPGDRVTLLARATDFDDVSGPNVAQSAELSFRVVTRDELLAELARREQEYRISFERLVESQEQLRGKALSVRATQRGIDGSTADLVAALAPLERRQRNLASSVNVARQQFAQILLTLRVNGLDTIDEVDRLDGGIINPLNELATRELVVAADTIRQWSREGGEAKAIELDGLQQAAVTRMREILSRMIQWEGYHEVVNMLRDIIRLQRELGDEAQQMLIDEADDVFDD